MCRRRPQGIGRSARHAGAAARALCVVALLGPGPASAQLLDDVAVERHDAVATVRVKLTGPVHYVRHAPVEKGEILVVYLEALAPETVASWLGPDEVKRSPKGAPVPRFTVRTSVGAPCGPAANSVCLTIQFERPVRYRVRLGDDRRSIVLEVAPNGDGARPAPAKGKS